MKPSFITRLDTCDLRDDWLGGHLFVDFGRQVTFFPLVKRHFFHPLIGLSCNRPAQWIQWIHWSFTILYHWAKRGDLELSTSRKVRGKARSIFGQYFWPIAWVKLNWRKHPRVQSDCCSAKRVERVPHVLIWQSRHVPFFCIFLPTIWWYSATA